MNNTHAPSLPDRDAKDRAEMLRLMDEISPRRNTMAAKKVAKKKPLVKKGK